MTLNSNPVCLRSSNGLELKAFLNEEIGKIKEELGEFSKEGDICDPQMKESIAKVVGVIDRIKESPINEESLKDILKFQKLVVEIKDDN